MTAPSFDWQQLRNVATGVLRRYRDPWTMAHVDDLAQEAVLAFWQWVARGAQVHASTLAMVQIARRTRLAAKRSTRWRALCPFPAMFDETTGEWVSEPQAAPECPDQDLPDSIAGAIATLRNGDLLARRVFAGATDADLAAEFGYSPSGCRSRVHRARRDLRERLDLDA